MFDSVGKRLLAVFIVVMVADLLIPVPADQVPSGIFAFVGIAAAFWIWSDKFKTQENCDEGDANENGIESEISGKWKED